MSLKPINECRDQNPVTKGFAHSNGKPDAPSTTINISVWFAPISTMELGIRRLAKKKNANAAVDLRTSLLAVQAAPTMGWL